jgi:PHD/YefM family antitoxin component YafN of YafNO toxin-antitoxin module
MKVALVTTLIRQTTTILADLKVSKEPVLITAHGRPAAYLVDVEDYELTQQRLNILEGIARGESAIAENRVFSQQQAKEKMSKWLAF